MKLLSDVEVLKILEANIPTFAARKVAQAQLESCEAELKAERERIIQEIDKEIEDCDEGYRNVLCIPKKALKSLKERIREGV